MLCCSLSPKRGKTCTLTHRAFAISAKRCYRTTGIRSRNILSNYCADGRWQEQSREAYDRGNGAVILLYNREKQTVVLVRQFRFPVWINGHDGF
jgi:hypothetical protein